ncbi:MAG: DUF2804 domain-containing protein [Sphaerochaetaceae bacterium]|nr:DUF2804 domain-containing protein [Sphaerochaetaceae bacterium]
MKEIKSWQEIINGGWARHPLWAYSRHHSSYERDLYIITSDRKGWTVCASIMEAGSSYEYRITYFDRLSGKLLQKRIQRHFLKNHRVLPEASENRQSSNFSCEEMRLSFIRHNDKRNILLCAPELEFLDARFTLIQPDDLESLCTMRSWKDTRTAFLFDRKLNCMKASGILRLGDETVSISEDENAFASLNIIRGRLPRKTSDRWLTCCLSIDDHTLGIDIVPGGESTLVYDGMLQRIASVKEETGKEFRSSDGRLDLSFSIIPSSETVSDMQFGYCTGKVIMDDGTVIDIRDVPAVMETTHR